MKLEFILKTVSEYYGLSLNIVKSDLRRKDVAKAKHIYFYLSSEFTKNSLNKIGYEVGKHHATVLHGINKIRIELNIYKDLKKEVEDIICMIHPKNKMIVENIDLLQLSINHTNSFINLN